MDPSPPDRLRAAGLRRTPARLAVLGHIEALARPVSHAELQALPELAGLDDITLYRTLATLVEAGLVHRVHGIDGAWRYGAQPRGREGCPGNHVHFLCTTCGEMSCLTDQPMPRVAVPAGAEVQGRHFLVFGRCAGCVAAGRGGAGAPPTPGGGGGVLTRPVPRGARPSLLGFGLAGFGLAGCGAGAVAPGGPGPAAEAGVVVLAAASLTEVLQEAGAVWAAKGHPAPAFSFDASSKLAKQIEAGAPADLYLSADQQWMDHLDGRGLLAPGTRVDLVGNTLVVVVPAASAPGPAGPEDLARPSLRRLGLAGENVPAGRYGRASLRSLGLWDTLAERVVSGDNVRTVLGWVATGEVDAGLVYATDAPVEPRVRVAFRLPASSHPPIVYPAAVVKGAPHPREAEAFLAFCEGSEGRTIFAAAGFPPPPGAP